MEQHFENLSRCPKCHQRTFERLKTHSFCMDCNHYEYGKLGHLDDGYQYFVPRPKKQKEKDPYDQSLWKEKPKEKVAQAAAS